MADTQTYTPSIFSPVFKWVDTLNVQFNRPLDNRTIVRKKADLKALGTAVYGGMLVTVAEENKTYMLKPDIRNIENLKNDTWVGVQDPESYIQNMDNWVVASNTSRIVDYLHIDQISSVTDLNNIYCVIEGGKPTVVPDDLNYEGADAGWQAAGLYVVIPNTDGTGVELHSLLSGGTIESLQATVDNLSTTVATLSTTVAGLSTAVTNLSTLMGTAPEGGLGSTVIEMLLDLPVALSTAEVQDVWNGVFAKPTAPIT